MLTVMNTAVLRRSALAVSLVVLAGIAPAGTAMASGLPQLDVSTFPSQIFWTFLTFGLLLWLMAKVALPRVGEVLEARQAKIANDLDKAAALKAESEAVMQAYEKAEAESRAKAQALIAKTVAEADGLATRRKNELATELAERTRTAEERIAGAKANAMQSLRDVSVEAAQSAVSRLVGVDLTTDVVSGAVDAVMKERA